jgi:iron complex outermembrane receptor protein
VRLNADVFYMKWKDLQMEAFRFLVPGDLSTNFEQTINIPNAVAKGAELELTARATEHFTIGGSLGYLDTEILDEPSCASAADPTCQGAIITGGYKVQLKGLDIPNAPHLTASLFGEYRWPVGVNSAWVRGDYQHRDSQYSDIEGLTNQQTLGPSPNAGLTRFVPADQFPYKVPAFDVFNLRGGFDWQRASVSLYVQNLTDENYYTGTYQKFGLSGMRLRPHPRTYGASVSFKF